MPHKDLEEVRERLSQMFKERSDGAGGLKDFVWSDFIEEVVAEMKAREEKLRAELAKLPTKFIQGVEWIEKSDLDRLNP